MTNKYTRSTDGVDTDDGSTWALAKATLTGANTVAAAGDTVFFGAAHLETSAANAIYAVPGTMAAPVRLLCVNDAGDPLPPTAVGSGAALEVTGSASITMNGSFYAYGLRVSAGVGSISSSTTLKINTQRGNIQIYDNCQISLASTGASAIDFGAASATAESRTDLKGSTLKFSAVGQRINAYSALRWDGGGLAAGSSAITGLFRSTSSGGVDAILSGVDLSLASASINLIDANIPQYGTVIFRNIKLPANWTGGLMAGAPLHNGFRAIMHNATSGTTLYPMWEEGYAGKVLFENVVVKTGGANNGSPLSWKLTTRTTASYPAVSFKTPELPPYRVTTTGSPITLAIDIITDGAVNLTDADVWLEVQYPGEVGAMTTMLSSAKATVLTPAADIAISTAAWTTTGLTTPIKQRLSVTFTPQRTGVVQGKVAVAKPSTVVYIDPKFVVV